MVDISNATPRPWSVDNGYMWGDGDASVPVRPVIQEFAVSPGGLLYEEAVANAELIVRAVNCHDELVAALALLLKDCEDYEAWQRPCYAVDVAKAALARAKGEAP